MKNKIIWKLSGYFAAALIVFAIIISWVFIALFRANTIELNKTELKARATKISTTLSSIASTGMGKTAGGGYGGYIKFLNDIAMADVWIVDDNLNIISYGMGQHAVSTTSQLPESAKQIVDEVLTGKTEFSESFSKFLDTPTLTVGTPIFGDNNIIIGAVLLHSPVNGIDIAVSKNNLILSISIIVALLLALILSIGLSYSFTKPLKLMNATAIKLADGDYNVKTGINQKDEIGTLANNLDILALRLNDASKESEKLENLRRDFIANISHELRTPVTVIRGSLEALNDNVISEKNQIKEYYSQMLSESMHLQRLINDLLDLSRLQNMNFSLEMSAVSLCDIISDVIRSAKSLANEKNITILFDNQAVDCSIFGDYGRLRQMLLIIMDNAVKFSPQNGHINITMSQKENLVLSIHDEGTGISEHDLPYIFDRFYKTKSNENKTGTGLGLSIAKQIANRHNINISVLSSPQHGSEFIFSFDISKNKQ